MARGQVVVFGAGQGGLSAAIHARLRGFDVLLLEQHETGGGKAAGIETAGYQIDPGPSILILTHLYEQVFASAGRRMEDYLRFRRLDPFTRVYQEGRGEPVDLPDGREACVRELARVVPEDAEGVKAILGRLDQVAGLIDKTVFARAVDQPWQLADPRLIKFAMVFGPQNTFREVVDRYIRSPLLQAFFYGFPSYSGQTYLSKSASGLLIPYYMLRDGVWAADGGVRAIPRAFERLARELGVEIRTGMTVTGLRTNGKRVTGLETNQGLIEAEQFVAGFDRVRVRQMLGRDTAMTPSYSYFTVHWGVRRKMPELKHHTLLVPSTYQDGFVRLYEKGLNPERPIVYLNEPSAMDPESAPEGRTNLFAVVTCQGEVPTVDWEVETGRMRQAVLDELERFGLGVDPGDVDFERVQRPAYFRERHGNVGGSLYGPVESERLWGLMPLRNWDEEFRNLFYAGGSVQPGAGLPMVTLSGKFAASALKG